MCGCKTTAHTGKILFCSFLGNDQGVGLGDFLILSNDLDLKLVFAFLQSQILRQFNGSFGVVGTGRNLDLLNILVGVGVELVLGGILIEVLDAGTALDPKRYQISVVAEMVAADAGVIGGIFGIHMQLHTDLAAAGALLPVTPNTIPAKI